VEGSFFCRDEGERARLLDLSTRLRTVEGLISVLFLAAALVSGFTFGWDSLAPAIPPLAAFWLLQTRLARFSRPELVLFGCLIAIEAGIAGGVVLARGPSLYLFAVMMVPALLASVVFPTRVAVAAVAISAALELGFGLGFDLPAVSRDPFGLLYPLEALVCGSGIALVVASLELATRSTAILDPLTGLPNRLALRARVAELEHQARGSGRPVALLVGDPDGFKRINDTRGHAVGDAVLRELGARIRAATTGVANAYRLGGEEFVILIGDANRQQAADIAERVRKLVCARAIEGLSVAISFGVAVSTSEQPFNFSELFGQADRALYEAKRSGGNRVRIWPLAEEHGGAQTAEVDAIEALVSQLERREQPGEVAETDRFDSWQEAHHAETGSWLVQDDVERRQLLELNRVLRERAKPVFVIGFALGAASASEYGWQILILPPVFTLLYIFTEHRLERLRRPELALGAAWLGLQAAFFASALLATRPMIVAGSLLFLLLVGSSAVFPSRGVAIGVIYTSLIMGATALLTDRWLLLHYPSILCFYIAIAAAIGMVGIAVGRSTIDFRGLGIIDQLTGLFNRAALDARVAELGHRQGLEVSLVLLDVDRFKQVNDVHGHAKGDAVLRELGYRVRKHLRAFESAYRVGGEEFLILLESVDRAQAEGVAQRLAAAVGGQPLAGLPVTASFGIATGSPAAFDDLYVLADRALYTAKQAGGNLVFVSMGPDQPARPAQGLHQPLEEPSSSQQPVPGP